MDQNRLAIVIPVYTGEAQLRRCLKSLYSSENNSFTVYLVDHGDTDDISRWTGVEFPEVRCIRGNAELWWAGATNLGIRHALQDKSRYIMLLNHDCYVRSDTISLLLNNAKNNLHTIIAPAQHRLQSDRTIYSAGTCFTLGFPTVVWPSWIYRMIGRQRGTLIPTRLILGGRGVVIDSETFDKVGLIDSQHFPHYGADHDFYLRCRKAGYRLFISTEAIIDVDDSKTSMADDPGSLSFKEFRKTLVDRRSHRNVRDLYALFSRYYPIRFLAGIGVTLNLIRYSILYVIGRILSF